MAALKAGEFIEVSEKDIAGKWSVFILLSVYGVTKNEQTTYILKINYSWLGQFSVNGRHCFC
jgi:hypothetical protein